MLRDDMDHLIRRQLEGWGSNFIFWGFREDKQVVFKCFHPEHEGRVRWNNELASLLHWADLGLVPKVLGTLDGCLIAMEHLAGCSIVEADAVSGLSPDQIEKLGEEFGWTIAQLIDVWPENPGSGYSIVRDFELMEWSSDLPAAICHYVEKARELTAHSELANDPFLTAVLGLIERSSAEAGRQRPVLYNDDLLCMVERGRIQGFYDLELTRVGTDVMQLARAFRWCKRGTVDWRDVRRGYIGASGRPVSEDHYVLMLANNLLHCLVRMTWEKEERGRRAYISNMRNESVLFRALISVEDILGCTIDAKN
jgi:hypothetical protein